VIALVVRVVFKDRLPGVAILYYMSPPILVMAACLLAAIGWRIRGRKKLATAFALLAVALIWSVPGASAFRRHDAKPHSLRVLTWNVEGRVRWASQLAEVALRYDPDIIGLVEAGNSKQRTRRAWQQAFPGYTITRSHGETILLCKKDIASVRTGSAGSHGVFQHIKVNYDGGFLNIILADVESDPRISRAATIQELTMVAESLTGPTLLMGDFNTPADSVHFQQVRKTFVNAFETCGSGYAATWPMPYPVLHIDHVWCRDVQIQACEHGWPEFSDHRPVIVHLASPGLE